jgi:DNA polymerase
LNTWEAFEQLVDESIQYLKTGFRELRTSSKPTIREGTEESRREEPRRTSPQWRSLQEIHDLVSTCTRCRLHQGRKHAVPGEGNAHADILLVGEGPGAEEDARGRPFVGKAGQLLTRMLAAIELTREEVFITNIVKCRPPQNRNPLPDESEACAPYLRGQIALIQPRIIVCLGGPAAQRLTGSQQGITKLRGRIHTYLDYPVLPTYHPAAVLRFPEKYKRPVWNDLKMLRDFYREIRA